MIQTITNTIHQFFVELHQNFEFFNQEFETTKRLRSYLEKANLHILELDAKTGMIAEIGVGSPVLALHDDIDVLPIPEQTTCDYCSKNSDVMHTSILMNATCLLKALEKDLKGTIRLLFQPLEENFSGALYFIEIGAQNGGGTILWQHNNPNLTINQITSCVGPFSASVDPIVVGAQIVNATQTISSRTVNGLDVVIVNITEFQSGNTWNVISEIVEMEGIVITLIPEIREKVKKQLKKIIKNITITLGVQAELCRFDGPHSIINDAKWVGFAKQVGYEIIDFKPLLCSEDFDHYLLHVSGAFINLGSQSPYTVVHHLKFQLNPDMIIPAVNYLSELAQ